MLFSFLLSLSLSLARARSLPAGGFKVWECSVDLCEHLARGRGEEGRDGAGSSRSSGSRSRSALRGQRVLELGCGQGLPGILCLMLGAEQVVFQDYNKEVLACVTKPCVDRNLLERQQQWKDQEAEAGEARYISGDWAGCKALLSEGSFDLILTAETVYEPKSVPALLDLLAWCLHPEKGVALVATKVRKRGRKERARGSHYAISGARRSTAPTRASIALAFSISLHFVLDQRGSQ